MRISTIVVPRMKSTAPQNETGINTTILTMERKNHSTATTTITIRRKERMSLMLCCMMVDLISLIVTW